MVMARELHTLLTPAVFCLLIDPGPVTVYVRPVVVARQAPVPATLMRTEQAMINTMFTCCQNYFMYR
jgi:hypothetical protein